MDNVQTYWDPFNETIRSDTYSLHTQKLVEKAESYQRNPFSIKRNLYLLLLLGIMINVVCFALFRFESAILQVFIVSFVPVSIYYAIIRSFQENFILFLMSQQNNWVYNPDRDPKRYDKCRIFYPNFFDVGHSQNIEDQLWGTLWGEKPISFWNCTFHYVTGSGKHQQSHNHTIVILRLYKAVPVNFDLRRIILLNLTGSDYKTESEEFNRIFSISMQSNRPDSKLQLLKVLSPSVQVRLIQLASLFPLAKIGFSGSQMILDFNGLIWKCKHTNFFKEVKVDARDTEHFKSLLTTMTAIPVEMLQYID